MVISDQSDNESITYHVEVLQTEFQIIDLLQQDFDTAKLETCYASNMTIP